MSVIGRLDEQVDAVLIKPLTERRDGDEPMINEQPDPSTSSVEDKMNSMDERCKPDPQLPVWML